MKIRFLYFEGCPHSNPAFELLQQTLKELKVKAEIEKIEIKTMEEAEEYGFLGSPTIQIDGIDIEKNRIGDKATMGCRIYPNGSGVPPKEMIVEAIKERLRV